MIIKDCKKYCIRQDDSGALKVFNMFDERGVPFLGYYMDKDFIINVTGENVGEFYYVKNRYGLNYSGDYIKHNGFYFEVTGLLALCEELVKKKDKPTLLPNMKHDNPCIAYLCKHLLGLYDNDFFIDTHDNYNIEY